MSWGGFQMVKYLLAMLVVWSAAIDLLATGAVAQGPPPLAAPFNPSFGDLMNTLVQPRHAKLGLIGREQNWTLAAYESHQLKDALSSIAKLRPRFRNQSVSDLMESMTGDAIKALDEAIQAGDARQFSQAYSRLTDGCNGCHAALNHAYVVIKVPDQSAFLNQDFRVPGKAPAP
jgi:hypothetical protein